MDEKGNFRVYCDTNAGTENVGYLLWFDNSRRDLAKIGGDLMDGLRVTLYMPGELELEAVLKFDEELGEWRGLPIGLS